MFKPGELANVSACRGDFPSVTILPGPIPDSMARGTHGDDDHPGKWPIPTSDGIYYETELYPAHPSVIFTASCVDSNKEAFRARTERKFPKKEIEDSLLFFKLRDKAESRLRKATLDYNGHWKNGSIIEKGYNPLEMMSIHSESISMDDVKALAGLKNTRSLDRWVPIKIVIPGLWTCSYCGKSNFSTETNGKVIRLSGDPCKFPSGLPLTEWELNVPSGKIVVANDLRTLFPLTDDDFNVNTTFGCRLTSLAYADIGMSHAFVGNSCPGIYKCSDGTFKISNKPYRSASSKLKFDGENIASVCTDLWWYSICDYEEFTRRLKHFKQKAKNYNIETVELKPGVYRFRHDEEARNHNTPDECVYTRFEWVREPDPVKDLLGDYEQVDINANAYVQSQVARWPTLYGKGKDPYGENKELTSWSNMTKEDQLSSWQAVADHVFCTIGGGTEWHEKGFPIAKVDPTVHDVDPPSFRKQYDWYPFSKPYGGLFEPKILAPSFAKLAFRVLESVISFGTNVRDSEHSRDVPYVRERMMVAVKRYRELAKKYPDQADPEYVKWLSQKGRAEAWVEKFDLGPTFTNKHKEHAKHQRWVPDDTYAVVFDARKLKDGHFAWHPNVPSVGGCWANKNDAQRYAINEFSDSGKPAEHNCCWTTHARNTSIPLYSIARVVKVGEVSHMGDTLVEVAFDYGTPWMLDPTKRKALCEKKEKAGISLLTKEEYEAFLPEAIEYYETMEKMILGKKA